MNLQLPGGKVGKGKIGSLGLTCNNQKGLTIQHRELRSIFCNNLNGKKNWKRIDTYICISDSICFVPEANTIVNQLYATIKFKEN